MEHPYFGDLDLLNLRDAEALNAVLGRIERSLLDIRDQIFQAHLLDALPRSSHLWFGINTPRDWFDHAVQVPRP